jgi:hypothetical protein
MIATIQLLALGLALGAGMGGLATGHPLPISISIIAAITFAVLWEDDE